jgi:hypothetical protein
LEAGTFFVHAPPGWEFHKLPGIDSYVGDFVGDGVRLEFDYGQYSNSFDEDNEPEYVVVHEKIRGYEAKIVHPRFTEEPNDGRLFP